MKLHRIITLVAGISTLVALLLLIDVRSTQATGDCIERVVEKDRMLILEESDILAIVQAQPVFLLQEQDFDDEQHVRLTACSLADGELRTYFHLHSGPYVMLEILASDADVLVVGDLNDY